jgi:hypothetical protein
MWVVWQPWGKREHRYNDPIFTCIPFQYALLVQVEVDTRSRGPLSWSYTLDTEVRMVHEDLCLRDDSEVVIQGSQGVSFVYVKDD